MTARHYCSIFWIERETKLSLHPFGSLLLHIELFFPSLEAVWQGSVSFSMSRSSAAANQLDQAGFQSIACITSGLQKVKPG